MLPAIDGSFELEYSLHALVDRHFPESDSAPNCAKARFVLIKIVYIFFERCNLFLGRGYLFLDCFHTLNRLFQALKVVNFPFDPVYDLNVWVTKALVHLSDNLLVFLMIRVGDDTLFFVVVGVKVDPSLLVLGQLLEKRFYTKGTCQRTIT